MFGAVSHLWPWYLVWGVAFGALLPQWWVSRFIAGVALLIPFTLATWWIPGARAATGTSRRWRSMPAPLCGLSLTREPAAAKR